MENEKPQDTRSPYRRGYSSGNQFAPDSSACPFEPSSKAQVAWFEGFRDAVDKINDRALAFLAMGTGLVHLHAIAPAAWAELMAKLIQVSGSAMATMFLGAELQHARQTRRFLTHPGVEPRQLMEVAILAATGKDLPEQYHTRILEEAYVIAAQIRHYVEVDTATGVKVNSHALMRRMLTGDEPMPETAAVIQATKMPTTPPPGKNSP